MILHRRDFFKKTMVSKFSCERSMLVRVFITLTRELEGCSQDLNLS